LTDAEPQQQDSDLQVGFGPELRVSTSITPNAKFLREPGRLKVHPCQHWSKLPLKVVFDLDLICWIEITDKKAPCAYIPIW